MIRYRHILLFLGIFESMTVLAQSSPTGNRTQEGLSLVLSPTSTRSIRGWKMGGFISANFGHRFFFGTFWLQSVDRLQQLSKSFMGVFGSYFFGKNSTFRIGTTIRAGFFEERFFSMIPSLEGLLKLNNSVSLSAGIGTLDRHPYFDLKTLIKLIK